MTKLTHQFVELIPESLADGVLYVSLTYGTVSHRCCCGCGREVVTPLTPTDWKLIFDGETISLDPSVGNWNFPCRSHYWIRNNSVIWAEDWSKRRINTANEKDRAQKDIYYKAGHSTTPNKKQVKRNFLSKFWKRKS